MNIDIDGAYLTFPDTLNCAQFKYIITIDGLAGSNRDLALLHMGSVLIKQYRSPYLEWYYNSIKPGLQLFSASTCAGVNLGQQYQSWTMTETFQQYCLPCKVQEAFLLQLDGSSGSSLLLDAARGLRQPLCLIPNQHTFTYVQASIMRRSSSPDLMDPSMRMMLWIWWTDCAQTMRTQEAWLKMAWLLRGTT
eukprot:scaffold59749_cov17-Tisochrysis_lutea.AAC.1